jgi:hypothetical protein
VDVINVLWQLGVPLPHDFEKGLCQHLERRLCDYALFLQHCYVSEINEYIIAKEPRIRGDRGGEPQRLLIELR